MQIHILNINKINFTNYFFTYYNMYKIKIKLNTLYKTLIISIFLLIIFYILNKYYFNNNKEHYLTYFTPYFNGDILNLSKFYLNDENNLNYFKKKMDYNIIKIGIIRTETDYELDFIKILISSYLSKSNLVKSHIYSIKDRIKSMDDLVNNKTNFLLTEFETYLYYKNNLKKNVDNIRFVVHLYKLYYYFFTLKKYNIFSITKIPAGINIGFLKTSETILYYYYKFLKDLGYEKDIDYHIKIYYNMNELFEALFKGEVQLTMFRTIYPQIDIKNILDNKIGQGIILLPFDIDINDVFFQKNNNTLFIDSVDLNNISSSYLPIKFGKNTFTTFKPDMNLCGGYKIMLSNIETDQKYTYNFIEFFYNNYKNINSILKNKGNLLPSFKSYSNRSTLINYHVGVKKFLENYGFVTTIDNPNCKYLVGVMPCTEETLKANNLFY